MEQCNGCWNVLEENESDLQKAANVVEAALARFWICTMSWS